MTIIVSIGRRVKSAAAIACNRSLNGMIIIGFQMGLTPWFSWFSMVLHALAVARAWHRTFATLIRRSDCSERI
jgi:hypothetical protein